jgi:hypothetical protein
MTSGQNAYYRALLESDKMTGKNEARTYLNKIKEEDEFQEKFKELDEKDRIQTRAKNIILGGTRESINIMNKSKDFFEEKSVIKDNLGITLYMMSLAIVMFITINIVMKISESNISDEASLLGILFTLLIIPTIYGIIVWLYSLISILKNDFKKDVNKIVWLISIILIPPSSLLYPLFKKQIIEK